MHALQNVYWGSTTIRISATVESLGMDMTTEVQSLLMYIKLNFLYAVCMDVCIFLLKIKALIFGWLLLYCSICIYISMNDACMQISILPAQYTLSFAEL